ncbi:recombination directionality factor-like protein [Kitasatospora sp. Ki12]
MALRIFETDPEAKPRPRSFAEDVVGRFRSGRMTGRAPESLNEWRVTTGDPAVAARVAEMLGGEPASWETEAEDNLEVLTSAPSVKIVIDSASAISSDMRLYGAFGSDPIHHCDGLEYLSPDEDKGKPCGCPELLVDRKALARTGRGPKPNITVMFKLEEAPELGLFRFRTGSWDLAKVLHQVLEALDEVGGPARAKLSIEEVSFVPKSGPQKGKVVSYNKPVIKVLGAVSAAAFAELPAAA